MPISVMSLALSFVLTAAFYGAGPLLLRLRKKPMPQKSLKWLHIGYTVILALIFAFYNSINGYKISFFPALLWGSIFYWWNCSYFDKKRRSSVPLPDPKHKEATSTDPVQPEPTPVLQEAPPEPAVELPPAVQGPSPTDLVEVKKPKRKPNIPVIILCIALALSLAGNVWQGISWVNNSAESAEKIRVLNNKLTQKEEAIKEYRTKVGDLNTELARVKAQKEGLYDHMDAALFLYNNIGFIVNGSSYYHNYECPVFQAASEYAAHNIEYCRYLGYGACPVCWD